MVRTTHKNSQPWLSAAVATAIALSAFPANAYTLGRERDAEVLSLGRGQDATVDLQLTPVPDYAPAAGPIGRNRGALRAWPRPISTHVDDWRAHNGAWRT